MNVFHPPKQVFFNEHPKLSIPMSGISRVNDTFYLQCIKIKRLHLTPRMFPKLNLIKIKKIFLLWNIFVAYT